MFLPTIPITPTQEAQLVTLFEQLQQFQIDIPIWFCCFLSYCKSPSKRSFSYSFFRFISLPVRQDPLPHQTTQDKRYTHVKKMFLHPFNQYSISYFHILSWTIGPPIYVSVIFSFHVQFHYPYYVLYFHHVCIDLFLFFHVCKDRWSVILPSVFHPYSYFLIFTQLWPPNSHTPLTDFGQHICISCDCPHTK